MKRIWFITGASRGFGALIAEEALRHGDNVVATARNPETVTSRLGQSANLLALSLDVTNEDQARATADAAVARFESIDARMSSDCLRSQERYCRICDGSAAVMF
jgi:NAD(P)-dependent dehydrogenase (short-subunit alcohol dehydrogenase family)